MSSLDWGLEKVRRGVVVVAAFQSRSAMAAASGAGPYGVFPCLCFILLIDDGS
jgi:hypothetical protein